MTALEQLPKFSLICVCLYTTCSVFVVLAVAFSETKTSRPHNEHSRPSPSLHSTLQNSFTPLSIIKNVAISLTPEVDPSGALSSLTLVRLSKQLISLDNKRNDLYGNDPSMVEDLICNDKEKKLWEDGLKNSMTCLTSSNWIESEQSLEALVEGTKSASVISRLLPKYQGSTVGENDSLNGNYCLWWNPLLEKIIEEDKNLAALARPHQLSGLKWSIDCFRLSISATDFSYQLPQSLQQAHDALDLPFTIRPGILTKTSNNDKFPSASEQTNEQDLLTVASFIKQVEFRTEKIETTSKRVVIERRQTAWEGDDNVPPFQYSGKSMERMP